ncbi:hypothetical protein ILUMI_01384 [Ignelater luminosus]|uniref:DDE-1 domain-containing protein n=1 Tax=Ignelater luminosus TaxID=2038154 RepID=A0A8K0DKD9_IGNLU|nr:hypothetical protein ILUMI_01384 [Ignelater luminosus]
MSWLLASTTYNAPFTTLRHRASSSKDSSKGFTQRNPSISLRTPESTSATRARSFNKIQVQNYFERLSDVIDQHSFEPGDTWNVDEQSHQKKLKSSQAKDGNKSESFVPPSLSFPRKNMKNELMDHTPPGAIGLTQEKGWMNSDVFLKWLKHFSDASDIFVADLSPNLTASQVVAEKEAQALRKSARAVKKRLVRADEDSEEIMRKTLHVYFATNCFRVLVLEKHG